MATGSSRQGRTSSREYNSMKLKAFDTSDKTAVNASAELSNRVNFHDQNSNELAGSTSFRAKGIPPGFSNDGSFTRLFRSSREDRSAMHESGGPFVPYLPQDDAVGLGLGADQGGIDAVEAQEVADLLNEELSRLLKMKLPDFWRTVGMDTSLQESLDSYLQFRRRWYDSPVNKNGRLLAGIIVGDQELSRRVFMVLYRMSLSLKPGLSASGDLSTRKHPEIIQGKQFFDVPKLLDICAIYGHDNPELTQVLVSNVFDAVKKYHSDLEQHVPILLRTIYTMHQRCCSTLAMLPSASASQTSIELKLWHELLEVLDFLNDVVLTLQSFISAFPQGSVILVSVGKQSTSRDQLLATLAAIHDVLLPILRKNFSLLESTYDSPVDSAAESRLKSLRFGLMELSWQLLSLSYLSEQKLVDQDKYAFIGDPRARGEAFVQTMSSMAGDLSEDFGNQLSGHVKEELSRVGALLRNVEKKFKLLEKVEKLRNVGFIALDDVQYEFIASLVSYTTGLGSQLPIFSSLSLTDQNVGQMQEANILYESKISHIKDIFPDYGDGFIAACLEAYDSNPEEVIQRILDGTLHPSLLSIDHSLKSKPDKSVATASMKEKGKAKVIDAPSLASCQNEGGNASLRNDKNDWTLSASVMSNVEADGLVQRIASLDSASSSTGGMFKEKPSSKISASALDSEKGVKGRFVRKEKEEANAALLLDEREEEDSLRTAVYAAQYEDEYDDSFDDLGTHIADGVEETESLVDLIASKSSGSASSYSGQSSKINTKANSGLVARGEGGTFRGNLPVSSNPNVERPSFAREPDNRTSNADRRLPLHSTRGRGRGRHKELRAQYFVKDGKNYSYKVEGSVAVSSKEEAEALKQSEEETVYGLGRGGNVPATVQGITNGNTSTRAHAHKDSKVVHGNVLAERGQAPSRGRGPRKGHDDHHRKDRAMKKHFASVGGM